MLAQEEDLALLGREGRERRLELRPEERRLGGRVGRRSVGGLRRPRASSSGSGAAERLPARVVERLVPRDGVEPGPEERARLPPPAARTARRNVSWQRSSARLRSPVSRRRNE